MNKFRFLALAAASVLALAACDAAQQSDNGTPPEPLGDAVAMVNGQPISKAQLDVYAERRGPQANPEDLVNDLISMELLAQAAIRDGLDRDPQVAGELASQRTALLAQAAVRERLESGAITDEQVATEYERFKTEDLGEELHARHILVEDEALARDLIKQLDEGAAFEALAREHSKYGSAENGGDLGWFEQDMMVEPFGERAAALEPGSYTKEPVQTRFGWHVIQLVERRAAEPPPLEQVSEEIRGYLQSQMVEKWVNELREAAEVEITLPEAAEEAVATEAAEAASDDTEEAPTDQ